MSQEFPTASLDITEDFHILHIAYVYFCYCIFKAKTYNWLPNTHTHTHTHTRMTSNNYKQKATEHAPSLANGHFTGSDAPFVCEIPTASTEKDIILLTLDWLWGRPQALLQRRNVSSVRVGLANGTKWTPSQNWGNLLSVSELHVPHRQCLTDISNAISASFTSIWPSFLRFLLYPQQSVPTLRYTCRHLPSAVPWISKERLLWTQLS